MSEVETSRRPWTAEEHTMFVEALEEFGSSSTGREWQSMANYMRTRTTQEIKLHAHKYFMKLQSASQQSKADSASTIGDLGDNKWSLSDDAIFENALAMLDESVPDRWEKVAGMLAGKSAEDVRKRYQKLLVDVARIEAGEEVIVCCRGIADDTKFGDEAEGNNAPEPGTITDDSKKRKRG